ncbi:MAG: response regulator transcription factor [Halieaceae bacterium]|nr:response regulator transcription factor [Halieaceae bacterium]
MQILLVDDHALFRQGLRFLLDDMDDRLSFQEADGLDAAVSAVRSSSGFDLVLMDFHMPGTSGLDALGQFLRAAPGSPVIVLSGEEDPSLIRQAIDAGASGFVPKSASPEVLIAALKLILAGGVYLPPSVLLSGSPGESPERGGEKADLLSERQTSVLLLAVQGKANKVIASELGIAEGTVKAHLSSAFKVLGVRNRTEALIAAAKFGLVPTVEASSL